MLQTHILKSQIIADLDKAFQLALEEKNYTAAVRAKELIGKLAGLFSAAANEESAHDFQNFSDEVLETFVRNAQENTQS